MRRNIILVIAVVGPLASPTYAQSGANGMSAPVTPGGGMTTGRALGQTEPENCGTPDAFKKCPPMPRHPLQHYPTNR
jgi:hypothetical protein